MMRYYLFFCFLLFVFSLHAQVYTISGIVKDSISTETLPGASVYLEGGTSGTMTDENGKYTLQVRPGKATVVTDYFGYKQARKTLNVNRNKVVNFDLAPKVTEANEVVLTGKRPKENVEDTKMSTIELDIKQIKKLPALMGEVDVIKNIQLLPGVQVAGEGNAGLYVRGGGPDQNLVMLDYATVYNPVHTVGIFSIFNSDMLGSAELYKGGIPAQFGGRLSSMVDIRTKTGNKEKLGVHAGIGLLASRLMVEGPIKKDKVSFMFAARRTYFDTFLKLSNKSNIRNTKLYFLDLNGKISWKINDKNYLDISGYTGKDDLGLPGLIGNNYGNTTGSMVLKHIFNENLVSQSILTYSGFNYNLSINLPGEGASIKNGIKEVTFRQLFNYDLNKKNTLTFGIDASHKTFYPGDLEPAAGTTIFEPYKISNQHSMEEGVFISNKQTITPRLSAEYGLRYSIFSQVGSGTVYKYSGAISASNIVDTTHYNSMQFIKTFTNPEPRASLRYMLSETSSLKASYNRMVQYIHLMSNSTSPVPNNIWLPSSKYINPETANQVALGYFRNFKQNTWEASVEGYYKKMNHVVDFVNDANIFLNSHLETEIRAGQSWAYGLEFFIRKNKGKTTGWISYTLSKVSRRIPGINNGQLYPANCDRRHNLNIVVSHDFNKRINISSTFVYGTGRPFTLPSGKYQFDYLTASYYTSRNGYRLKAYNRMDIAMTINFNTESEKGIQSSLVLSIYNVYGRKNPYTVIVTRNSDGSENLKMVYLFRWLPSVTYNVNF